MKPLVSPFRTQTKSPWESKEVMFTKWCLCREWILTSVLSSIKFMQGEFRFREQCKKAWKPERIQFPPSMRRNLLWLYKYLLCKLWGVLESFKSWRDISLFHFWKFLMAGCENVDMRWKNPTKRELANLESLKISRGEVISTWKNVKLKVLVTQPRPTLCDPMDCGPPGSSVHGILQTRVLEWLAIPSSRESSWPRDQTLLGVSVGVANQMVSCWIIISQIDFILAFSVCVYEL